MINRIKLVVGASAFPIASRAGAARPGVQANPSLTMPTPYNEIFVQSTGYPLQS